MLRVTKERTPLNSTYKLKGQELAELSTSNYLVVDLSSNLDWKEHIDRTGKKANKALGFLRPNHLPMSLLSVQTWNTVPLFGVLIQTNPSRNWRWFKEDQLGTAPMDTTTRSHIYATGSKLGDARVEKDQTPACNSIQDHGRPS